ncbi:MAG: hypothetical protein ACRD2K_03510 [Terriglobales bacterium]
MATRSVKSSRGDARWAYWLLALLSGALGALALLLPPALPAQATDQSEPQLADTSDNPQLKYAVAHGHRVGWCYGYLYISREGVRYEVSQPESDKPHAFTLQRAEIVSAGKWSGPFGMGPPNWFSFKPRKGGQISFKHIRVQNVETGQLARDEGLPYTDLVEGYNNFDAVLARVQEQENRLHPPPPQPPVIRLTEPAGADAGQSVDALGPTLRARGVAAQASGVSAVAVNGLPASLKMLTPQTAEFEASDIPLNPGTNSILGVATATDQTQGQLSFQVRRPEVRILEPAATFETSEAAVNVRGVAIGFRAVEKAKVGGTAATLAQRDDGSVEFTAEGVPVARGANALTGSVTGANGAREDFRVELKRVAPPGPPPLTLAEVEEALKNGISKTKVASLVGKFGVDFPLSDENERRLRAAGADGDLLLIIARSKK